jgi:hypothetical protein
LSKPFNDGSPKPFKARHCSKGLYRRPSLSPCTSACIETTHGHVVAHQVQQGVLEHGAVTGTEHEAVTVGPFSILGVGGEELLEEDVAHGGTAHGKTRVARVRLKWRGEEGVGGGGCACDVACRSHVVDGRLVASAPWRSLLTLFTPSMERKRTAAWQELESGEWGVSKRL